MTNDGYRLYETNNFTLVNDVDDYQNLIGNLKLAIPLFKSRIILFVGKEDNPSFPDTQLVVWDDMRRMKIGMIILKEKIINFYLTKNAIFIMIKHKMLVFELVTLKYVCSFEDVDLPINKMSISLMTNPIIMAYGSWSNKSIIKINKCKL